MNIDTHKESHARIERLKRQIFWRNGLGAAINLAPSVGILIHAFTISKGGIGRDVFLAMICLGMASFMFLLDVGGKAIHPFFGKNFAVKQRHFIAAKERDARERERKLIAELEQDMRTTGIFEDSTKETP